MLQPLSFYLDDVDDFYAACLSAERGGGPLVAPPEVMAALLRLLFLSSCK